MTTRAGIVAEARSWAIYGLRCPADGRFRYVGFSRNAALRYRQHIAAATRGKPDYPVYRWIRKIAERGLVPELELLEVGKGPWESVEKRWIEALRIKGHPLLNVALGGYFDLPVEARKRAAEKNKGRRHSEDALAKIAAEKRGRKRPDVAARNRSKLGIPSGPLRITDAERERRSAAGKMQGSINATARWQSMSATDLARVSFQASEQMKRVWAERKRVQT